MFVGSFIIGSLPNFFEKYMKLISIIGAGLLVGVALIIIIPEGFIELN